MSRLIPVSKTFIKTVLQPCRTDGAPGIVFLLHVATDVATLRAYEDFLINAWMQLSLSSRHALQTIQHATHVTRRAGLFNPRNLCNLANLQFRNHFGKKNHLKKTVVGGRRISVASGGININSS
jgi:hypothetical protein